MKASASDSKLVSTHIQYRKTKNNPVVPVMKIANPSITCMHNLKLQPNSAKTKTKPSKKVFYM